MGMSMSTRLYPLSSRDEDKFFFNKNEYGIAKLVPVLAIAIPSYHLHLPTSLHSLLQSIFPTNKISKCFSLDSLSTPLSF